MNLVERYFSGGVRAFGFQQAVHQLRVVDFSRLVGLGPVSVFGHGEVNLVVLDHDLLDFPFLHLSDEGAIVRYVYFPVGQVGEDEPVQEQDNQDSPQEAHEGVPFGGVLVLYVWFHRISASGFTGKDRQPGAEGRNPNRRKNVQDFADLPNFSFREIFLPDY